MAKASSEALLSSGWLKPLSPEIITAESDYGIKVPAVIEQDNFFGTQFHPEKSGEIGSKMIQNFLNECKK